MVKTLNSFGGGNMERVFVDDPDLDKQYAAYRSNPNWKRIYDFLRQDDCYWHVTNPEAWEAIRASGAIKPNIDGRYHQRFGTTSTKSFGYIHKPAFPR